MNLISELELARICEGIHRDGDAIYRHNPIGTRDETLLWMLLSCLISYLSLDEIEIPCFTGMPDAATYRNAILFILQNRRSENFTIEKYLDAMIKK